MSAMRRKLEQRDYQSAAIKVGIAIDLSKRIALLQVGNPLTLRLVAAFRGTSRDEAAVHARFSHLRMVGEWFRADTDLIDFIKALP